ncbi:hypothetical protein IGJ55_001742 [Enterococcus sp. AZ170]|uniref:hypothetical protein n=1 Tax=Enterococcus sp. AZ170 TaxID=2774747 RepID=UPI003D2FBB73
MKKGSIVGIIVGSLLLTGCSTTNFYNRKKEVGITDRVSQKNDDGTTDKKISFEIEEAMFSVDLIKGWKELEVEEVYEDASVALSNMKNTIYYVVIGENKEDFESLDFYKELIIEQMIDEPDEVQEKEVTRNGLKGTNYTFYQAVDGIKFFYDIDILEGKEHFVQSISWTLKSKAKTNQDTMEQLLASIEEK